MVLACIIIMGVCLITFFSLATITEIKEFYEERKLLRDTE